MKTNNKLRKALTKILNLTNSLDEDCAVDPVEIRDIARAALAEPVKNCEVGTAAEQARRFEDLCLEHIGCAEETGGRHCVGCPLEKASKKATQKCELYWAQMPYKEGVPNAE